MSNGNEAGAGIKSLENWFRIMELLKTEEGQRITDISDRLGISKSTAHRHLTTMEQYRFVVKQDGVYKLGMRFLEFGNFVQHREEVYSIAEEITANLATRTGEVASFVIIEHGKVVCVFRELGEHAVGTDFSVGDIDPIHATAGGKALLSRLSNDRVLEVLGDQELPKYTEHTITDIDTFLEELERIRDQGISYNNEESVTGLRAVGTPIVDSASDSLIGAFTVSGPANRLTDARIREDIEDELLGAANELELRNSQLR
jgi:DNA-binding IclR family transcriptional regulator